MIVYLTNEAERDLESIADYIAKDNPRRAITFVRELRSTCLNLPSMPEAFPLVPRYEKYGVRRRIYRNYLIFYRLESDHIIVLHVLHGAMDYASVLFRDAD